MVWQGSNTQVYNTFLDFPDSVSTAAATKGMCPISYSASITTNAGGHSLAFF
jgi:hypothetical protein